MIHHTYSQSTGRWWNEKGELLSVGYSGAGDGKNNPKSQGTQNVGPIPRGIYVIGAPYDSKNVGPFALPLVPSQHNALGRTNFLIHGDSLNSPGTASKGCVILPRAIRELIHSQNCRLVWVIE